MTPRAILGVVVVFAACAVALLAPVLAPYDPTRSSVFFLQRRAPRTCSAPTSSAATYSAG
jgi:hypothetical protein